MILTAHQVGYMPWLGLFAKIASSDKFVCFDDVQYEKRGWNNRNYIKAHNGPVLLTVPVESNNHFAKKLREIEIVPGNWQRKHMRSIELTYKRAPYFEQHYRGVGAILDQYADGGLLIDLNMELLRYFMRALGIQVPIVKASDYTFRGMKSELVLDMCRQLGATKYIFGGEGDGYADKQGFMNEGIEPIFRQYEHPEYPQQHGAFAPRMAIIDLLMNCGPDSLDILMNRQMETT